MVKPTGLSVYTKNILPYLESLAPTALIAEELSHQTPFQPYPIPSKLSADYGSKGHLRRLLWTQFQLPRIYHKLKSNLLFSPTPEAPLYSNCNYIIMVHDLIPLRFPRRFALLTPYFRYYVPQVLRQAKHIVCNSTATAKDLTNFFDIPPAKITPVLLAYDVDNFRSLNLPTGNYFLYLGRHDPYKNLKRLIQAFVQVLNIHDCDLWIAGPTDRRFTPGIQSQIEALGITHRIKFLDYVPYNQLPIILNQAISLVFPSLWEGFGLPVLEAMACGTPVITSNISSLPEVAGEAAILVDPYNVNEIADALKATAEDAGLRSRLRNAGLARASLFNWEKTGRATVEVLQRHL